MSIERSKINELLEACRDIHRAFGAPGNFAYSTAEGRALYLLYKAEAELRATISSIEARS